MLEIEAKYPLADHDSLAADLRRKGANLIETRGDADHYFNAPDRDFARTDEAFRLRRIGRKNYLTYKGPKIDAVTKTRKEIEVAIAEGDEAAAEMIQMVESLGYRPVAVVRKQRSVYEWLRDGFAMHFCLDDVEKVGRFAEIEIVAEESQYQKAKELLEKVAGELGFGASERRSYLEMFLANAGKK
jgi:adenylate cyclase class 2